MRVTLKQLKSLEVETARGKRLGKIHDLIFDIDSQSIVQYDVRSSMIGGKEYLISRDQIIRFEEEKIIVDDTAGVADTASVSPKKKLGVSPEPIVMRKSGAAKP